MPVAADRLARIDRELRRYIDDHQLPGAVALVLRDGQPIYERALGWSDKEAGRKMSIDTLFRIASQTKALTSVAALVLLEQARLELDDPVSRFIPAFENTTVATAPGSASSTPLVAASRPITIRDLLTHTSGISYGTQSQLATLPFLAQPGESWVYGYSTDVLGCVVERTSGLPQEQRPRLAAVYSSGRDTKLQRAPDGPMGQGNYVDGPRRNFSGGAGLHSSRGMGFGLGFETVERFGANG